jgi:hypothetical protein
VRLKSKLVDSAILHGHRSAYPLPINCPVYACMYATRPNPRASESHPSITHLDLPPRFRQPQPSHIPPTTKSPTYQTKLPHFAPSHSAHSHVTSSHSRPGASTPALYHTQLSHLPNAHIPAPSLVPGPQVRRLCVLGFSFLGARLGCSGAFACLVYPPVCM